jgi:hypothetical protein
MMIHLFALALNGWTGLNKLFVHAFRAPAKRSEV